MFHIAKKLTINFKYSIQLVVELTDKLKMRSKDIFIWFIKLSLVRQSFSKHLYYDQQVYQLVQYARLPSLQTFKKQTLKTSVMPN